MLGVFEIRNFGVRSKTNNHQINPKNIQLPSEQKLTQNGIHLTANSSSSDSI